MADEVWTIGQLLTWTTDYLKQRGGESPRLDAEVLLAHARRCERIQLYTAYGETADDELRDRFRELVRRRSEGTPVAYLVGRREFFSLSFEVTPAVLIPRPETELLVLETLDRAARVDPDAGREQGGPRWKLLEVGCGSGCLAVSLAKHLPRSEIVAVDVCEQALEVARRNAAEHAVDDRIEFRVSDLLEGVDGESCFDVIVSNPPYVSDQELVELPPSVRDFEPKKALAGGGDGSRLTLQLIDQAVRPLRPGGWLLFETSPMLAPQLLERLQAHPAYSEAGLKKDLAGHARVLSARRTSVASTSDRS